MWTLDSEIQYVIGYLIFQGFSSLAQGGLNRGRLSVGAVGAAAPKLFSKRLFCTHKIPLKPVNFQEFHLELMEFDFLHPQLSISNATPVEPLSIKQMELQTAQVKGGILLPVQF